MASTDKNNEQKDLPPGQISIKRILRWGKDHSGIKRSIPEIDMKSWVLVVNGEVEKQVRLDWNDFSKLPMSESVSDFHCVEGWSVLNCRWEGARFKQIVDLVKPKAEAAFVLFECADDYTTSFPLEELLEDGVLLACRINGVELEPGLGFPLRLVVPSKYAYKSAMWIREIRFMRKKELGYWEKRGYSDTADVWKNDRFSK